MGYIDIEVGQESLFGNDAPSDTDRDSSMDNFIAHLHETLAQYYPNADIEVYEGMNDVIETDDDIDTEAVYHIKQKVWSTFDWVESCPA